jgi:membrane associated rhomboid family serine protease
MLRFALKTKTIISIGLFCLALGGITLNFLPRHLGLSADVADAVTGLLYGIAIAALLTGVWRKSRRRSAPEDHPCA